MVVNGAADSVPHLGPSLPLVDQERGGKGVDEIGVGLEALEVCGVVEGQDGLGSLEGGRCLADASGAVEGGRAEVRLELVEEVVEVAAGVGSSHQGLLYHMRGF